MSNVIETPPKMVADAMKQVATAIRRDFGDQEVAWAGAAGAALYAGACWAARAELTEEQFMAAAKIEWNRATGAQ